MGQESDSRGHQTADDSAETPTAAVADSAPDDYFDQLAAIKQNIVEGVITCW